VEEMEVPSKASREQGGLSANDIAMVHMVDGLMDVDDLSNEMVKSFM
jgi:hypothetical protein